MLLRWFINVYHLPLRVHFAIHLIDGETDSLSLKYNFVLIRWSQFAVLERSFAQAFDSELRSIHRQNGPKNSLCENSQFDINKEKFELECNLYWSPCHESTISHIDSYFCFSGTASLCTNPSFGKNSIYSP